jgi:predicted ATPase/DNA-binding XRE family transcriptional regulator
LTRKASFGQWLKQRRKALSLTQEDLARRIGCAAVTLRKIEADERRPSEQIAELLAQQLSIPADELKIFIRFARAETAGVPVFGKISFHSPTNLPPQPTLLIGRDADVAAIYKRLLLPESRLLTLLGPPGIGKTRLAQQAAAEVLDAFAHGVFFVALAPISDASLVVTTIANTLGIPNAGPQTPQERLKLFLRDKQMLLVLDNFEQILSAAPQIGELLAACPLLKILVTSRAPLRIRPERQFPVPPLDLPDLDPLPDVENLAQYSAVTLFLERAQAVKPDFALVQDNAPTVAAICSRLDGLPLAIELISARVKLLPPTALLERLSGRLMLQSDGLRDIEPRHRTLNNAIDWSYQLLSVDEQVLFRRIGVFEGGWTLDAAEAVCVHNLSLHVIDGLASLLDKSLIKQEAMSDGSPRFMMLETIREYALGQLANRGELETLQQLHARYFMTMVDTLNSPTGEPVGQWLEHFELELANLRVALNWSQAVGASEVELRMALGLFHFWRMRGHMEEGSTWLQHGLALYHSEIDQELRAKALNALGLLFLFQGDLKAAQAHFEESLTLFRILGDTSLLADILNDYGMVLGMRGNTELAISVLEESLALWRQVGDTSGIAQTLFFRGNLAYLLRDNKLAGALWEESLAAKRAFGDTWMIANLLPNLAMVALDQGDHRKAEAYLTESLTILREMGERWQIVHTLEVCACLAAQGTQANLLRSARIFGATEKLRETLAAPMMLFQRDFNERGIAHLRAQLDEETFRTAWAEGRGMTLEQTVADALEATSG